MRQVLTDIEAGKLTDELCRRGIPPGPPLASFALWGCTEATPPNHPFFYYTQLPLKPEIPHHRSHRHSREGGSPGVTEMPVVHQWIPAFAGMTSGMEFSGFPVLQV